MKVNFIKNFTDVKAGVQYIKDDTGELKICCMFKTIEAKDLKTGMMYYKNFDEQVTYTIFKRIIKENNINTVAELVEYLAFKSNFKMDEFNLKKEFNPFIKILDGTLKIKSKNGYFTKTQVKKILCHKDSKISIVSAFTDDYYFDAENNFFENVEMNNIDALEEVFNFFDGSGKYEEESHSFHIYVAGNSRTLNIVNENIILV